MAKISAAQFLELGYELFQDKGRLKAHFLEADVSEVDGEAEGGDEVEGDSGAAEGRRVGN